MIATLALLGFLALSTPAPPVETPSAIEESTGIPADGSRVLFIGDSITQAGDYVIYLEAFLLTRFPDRSITIINHGLSSETAAGTSEADHPGRRPWIHDRFERDVTAWAPDRVVACYGMNDGIYHPFDPERFRRYREGMLRLIERARDEAGARVDVLTPPPYDPYRRQVGDPEAERYGYRYPAIDYDRVLRRYADWLRSIADADLLVADVNREFSEHVEARRADRVSFSLMPDGIHPDPTGHWLIAQALLRAWGAPAEVAEAQLDAEPLSAQSGAVGDLIRQRDGTIAFSWRTPLPMPLDPRWDPESILLERVAERLNRHRLRVKGLGQGRYRLLASEAEAGAPEPVGTFAAEELAEGIDLTALPAFPTVAAAQQVLVSLRSHRSAQAKAWRDSLRDGGAPSIPPPGEDDELMRPIREGCRPRELLVRIEPIADRGR